MYRAIDRLVCVVSSVLIMSAWACAQLSQADYTPTDGGALTLNLSAGKAFCHGGVVSYNGGTLTMANNADNYVFIDPAWSCVPNSSITPFAPAQIPIAKVITANGSITFIIDFRNWLVTLPCKLDSSGAANCVALGSDQNITLTPTGIGVVKPRNLATDVNAAASGQTVTFYAQLGNTQRLTLEGDVTASFLYNASAGQQINFIICENATGGWTFTWPTSVQSPPAINTAPNACTYHATLYDGTNAVPLNRDSAGNLIAPRVNLGNGSTTQATPFVHSNGSPYPVSPTSLRSLVGDLGGSPLTGKYRDQPDVYISRADATDGDATACVSGLLDACGAPIVRLDATNANSGTMSSQIGFLADLWGYKANTQSEVGNAVIGFGSAVRDASSSPNVVNLYGANFNVAARSAPSYKHWLIYPRNVVGNEIDVSNLTSSPGVFIQAGPEQTSNGSFSTVPDTSWTWGTGWQQDTTNLYAVHTADSNTDPLEQNVSAVAAAVYQVLFTVKNRTAGSVTPELGGVSGTTVSTNQTFAQQIQATGAGNLKFTPSSDFNGAIDDVSVRRADVGLGNFLAGQTIFASHGGSVTNDDTLGLEIASTNQGYGWLTGAQISGARNAGLVVLKSAGVTTNIGGLFANDGDYAIVVGTGTQTVPTNATEALLNPVNGILLDANGTNGALAAKNSHTLVFRSTDATPTSYDWTIKQTSDKLLRIQSGSPGSMADRMVLDSAGKVGIGTTSPSGTLHVGPDGSQIKVGADGGGRGAVIGSKVYQPGSCGGTLEYAAYWAYDAYFDPSNCTWTAMRPNLGRKWKMEGGYHLNDLRFSYSSSGNPISWTDFVAIKSDGKVGIGTFTPNRELEVNGGVRLNTATGKPTCDTNARGTFWVTLGGTGVKDAVEVCAKDTSDLYAWRTLY